MSVPEKIDSAASFDVFPVADIHPCRTNPRVAMDSGKLAELAESIRAHGVLQPLLVRPIGDSSYEVVCGHRRLEAARVAGLAEVPAVVRELDDREVLEVQVIENLQRADLHELEEADGYGRLHETFGYDVETIAAKVGKSKAYVYARMKLRELPAKARELFLAGKLTASTALLVARIPRKELAEKAAQEIARGGPVSSCGPKPAEPMSYRNAARWVEQQYMLRLSEAQFSKDDEALVPKAGSCAKCPKRTGAQRELFADVQSADVCTDPVCWREKQDAYAARRTKEAEDTGAKVLSPAETKKVFRYGGDRPGYDSGLVALDDTTWKGRKEVPVAKLVKGADAPVVIARHPETGRVVEMVPRSVLDKALGRDGAVISGSSQDYAKEQKRKAEKKRAVAEAAIAAVLEAATDVYGIEQLRFLMRGVLRALGSDTTWAIAKRHELNVKQGEQVVALEKVIAGSDDSDLERLLLEMVISSGAGYAYGEGYGRNVTEACKLWGVDLKSIEKDVSAAIAAKRRTKVAKKKPVAKPKAAAAKKSPRRTTSKKPTPTKKPARARKSA